MIREVRNIDQKSSLYFSARTPYEAMTQLVYYLNTKDGRNAKDIQINKTESGNFLYVIYKGETYATKM